MTVLIDSPAFLCFSSLNSFEIVEEEEVGDRFLVSAKDLI
jgi:hypothetical protein